MTQSFEVEIPEMDLAFTVGADETMANAAESHGVPIPVGCRDGKCGSCIVRVIEGEVEHRDGVLTPESRAQGWMCTCVSRATSPKLVVEL